MQEEQEILFLIDIHDFLENEDSLLFFFNKKGEKITLRAKSFQKSTSKNRIKFIRYSFVNTEYLEYSDQKNKGYLKRGDYYLSPDLNNQTMFKFVELISKLFKYEEKINPKLLIYIIFIYNNYQNGLKYENIVFLFLIFYLRFNNINFTLYNCANCGNKQQLISFLMYQGGMICKNCLEEKYGQELQMEFINKIQSFFSISKIFEINSINFNPFEEEYLRKSFIDYFNNELGISILL